MRAGQDAGFHADGADGPGVPPVDAVFASQDAAAHHMAFQRLDRADDVTRGPLRIVVFGQRREHLVLDLAEPFPPLQFVLNAVGLAHEVSGPALDFIAERLVLVRRAPVPGTGAGLFHQGLDIVDHNLKLLMPEHDGPQHDLLGKLPGFRFHHQHRRAGPGHDQVQFRPLQVLKGGIQHIAALLVADPGRADRPVKRRAGERDCGRGADNRENIRVNGRIQGEHRGDDLDFVPEAFREQRAHGPVDQAAGQGFFFRWPPLALEEAARDLAGGIGLFLIIDREREKILSFPGLFSGHAGDQHDRIAHADHDRAGRLPGDPAGFQGDRVITKLKCFCDAHECVLKCLWVTEKPKPAGARV